MAITITTTSSTGYLGDKSNAIYPAYVNNMPYVVWTAPPANPMDATIANNMKSFFQLKAVGGTTSTYTWNIESGTLPPGLSLATDGTISGTPTTVGNYTFVVKATNASETATKELTLQSKDFASKWYRDAKFGIIIHWGRFTDPQITTITGDTEFQSRIGEFNATVWAAQLQAWGCKVLHFSVIWQDSFRNWPSVSPTRYELKSSRDIVGEIIDACHAVGIKVVGYYPVDFQANPTNITDYRLPNLTWGQMNQELILELINKGLDGLWLDVGAAWETPDVGAVEAWWYPNSAIPRFKFENPDFIMGINAGVRRGGTQLGFPYMDFVIYESVATNSQSATLLETAVPLASNKKMAIDVSNMITANFAFGVNGYTQPKKNIEGVKQNLLDNWENEATVMIALPVQANGNLRHPNFASYMDELGAFVVANQGYSVTPQLSVAGENLTVSTGNTRARVYYTKDGSHPNKNDYIYLAPIKVEGNTNIKFRSKQSTLPLSLMQEYKIENTNNTETSDEVALFSNIENDILAKDAVGYHRGMMITVGNTPVLLKKIGRKTNGSTATNHEILIKRYWDNYLIYKGSITSAETDIDGGYQYIDIPPTRLEAGMSYIITSKENNVDFYSSNLFATKPSNSHIRIVSPYMLSVNGDKNPIVQDNIGQFINLKYEVLEFEKTNDLCRGKPATMNSNTTGNQLSPSAGIYYAVNATDGDLRSNARAGGEYAWTLIVDLLEIQKVGRVKVVFETEVFSTNYKVYTSLDGISLNVVGERVNNNVQNGVFLFDPVATRYILVRSFQPSAQNQYGGQMSVRSLEAYAE